MTFLEIFQMAWRQVPLVGTVPGTITDATALNTEGRVLHDLVNTAWLQIQNEREDWIWMRVSKSINTVASQKTYTVASDFAITDMRHWDRELFTIMETLAIGPKPMICINEKDFTDLYLNVGSSSVAEGVPRVCTVNEKTRDVVVYPTPKDTYTLKGAYFKWATSMSADSDVPDLPAPNHEMIVWKTVQLMGENMGKPRRFEWEPRITRDIGSL